MGLKKSLRRFVNFNFGLDIVKYSPGPSDVSWWITQCDVDLVFDVGANTGQFAHSLFKMGYRGNIVSFEPLSNEYERLLRASKSNPRWTVAERCAIGDVDGEISINRSRDSLSSSVLPVSQTLHDVSPDSLSIGSETVKMYKLSTVATQYIKRAQAPFLKIDVQGYEDKVLKGAAEILSDIKGLELELSFVSLYKDQWLIEDMLKEIRRSGFYLHTLKPFFRTETGRDLQAEAIFFKNGYFPRKQV